MRGILASFAMLAIAASCSPYLSRIQADHAREFGCEQRWVRVSETGEGEYEATGCGFASDWVCRDRRCRMRDHRAYGVDAP